MTVTTEIRGPGGTPGNDSGDRMVEPQQAYHVDQTATLVQDPPPNGMRDWELSWSRRQNLMRLRLDGQEWLFKSAAGKVRVLHADSETGRVDIRCKVRIENDTAFLYLTGQERHQEFTQSPACVVIPPTTEGQQAAGVTLHPLPTQETRLPYSHWRLCYNRAGKDWRLRNERTGDLWLVKEYHGECNLNWMDNGSHVFHDGPVVIDVEGTAHFLDPELEAEGT